MKRKRIFFIILFIILLGLSACSSQEKKLAGKYIDKYDETHYLSFNEDGSFVDNFLTTTSKGNTDISDFYIYQIDKDGFITIISTLENEFQDSLDKYELGWLYNDSIGIWLDGTLPITETQTYISCLLNGYIFEFHFNNDGTYEHTSISNNEIVHTDNGIYTTNENEVVCTSEEGVTTTFISAEDKVFCVQYIKIDVKN